MSSELPEPVVTTMLTWQQLLYGHCPDIAVLRTRIAMFDTSDNTKIDTFAAVRIVTDVSYEKARTLEMWINFYIIILVLVGKIVKILKSENRL